jgi:hypothetical protein
MGHIVGGRRKTVWLTGAVVAVLSLLVYARGLSAQTVTAEEGSTSATGFTWFEEFRGSSSSKLGQSLTLDTSVGFNFGSHAGIDLGVPLYRSRATDFLGTSDHSWQDRVGDPYADIRANFNDRAVDYATVLTFAIPVQEAGTFSTGRLGVDWFNHFDHSISRYTPFVNIGIANGILDTRLLNQPYRSLQNIATQGFLFYTEGGASVQLSRQVNAGASYYHFVPSGNEQIFSQNLLVQPAGSLTVSQITHDHGITTFIRLAPTRFLYIEPSFVHNFELNDNAIAFRIGMDFRSATTRTRGPSN